MEDEWFEDGQLHLVGGLEKLDADHGECLECTMTLIDDNYVHETDCPHANDDEDDSFDSDDDDGSDFEDVEDIDLLINDAEAEALINQEEDIPDEDLRDTVFEEVGDFVGDGEEDGAGEVENVAESEEA